MDIRDRVVSLVRVPANSLLPHPKNAREHPDSQRKALRAVLQQLGFAGAILAVERDGRLLTCDGHLRNEEMGAQAVPVLVLDLSDAEVETLLLTHDPLAGMASTNRAKLDELLATYKGFEATLPALADDLQKSLDAMLTGLQEKNQTAASGGGGAAESVKLMDRFVVPPFSVLDARQGYWQERKRQWLALGIQSEVGRGENLLRFSEQTTIGTGGRPAPALAYANQNKTKLATPMNAAGCDDPVSRQNLSADRKRGGPRPGGGNAPARTSNTYSGGDAWTGVAARPAAARTFGSGGPGDLGGKYNHVNGLLMHSDSGNESAYYWKKQAVERELGRTLTTEEFQTQYYQGPDTLGTGTSIFDPVLCELAYRWYSPPGGLILDPFAGGSVRGIVAGKLGRGYLGIDLRPEQIEANQWQAVDILSDAQPPAWVINENNVATLALENEQQLRGHWHLPGGSKQVVLERLMAEWPEQEVVYASPAYGFAQIAVAAAAAACGKQATIFVAKRNEKHARTRLAERFGANIIEIEAGRLNVVQANARKHCEEHGARQIPFGCDFPEFIEQLAQVIRDSGPAPAQAWCCAGSGVLARAMRQAWPETEVCAVQIGREPETGGARLLTAPEKFEEDASDPPAFPSCSNYDAKVWQFFKAQAQPGAVYWNVGADGVGDLPQSVGNVEWRTGDSREAVPSLPNEHFDLLFSCPPYADLELYSDDPADISNMDYPAFLAAYRDIIAASCAKLRTNRFAVWVIGEVRGPGNGSCRGVVQETIKAFQDAGLELYNDAILVTSCGSLPLRVGKQFTVSRKLGRTHQYVLVFVKGDAREATAACGEIQIDEEFLKKIIGEAAETEGIAPEAPAAAAEAQTENAAPSTLEPSS